MGSGDPERAQALGWSSGFHRIFFFPWISLPSGSKRTGVVRGWLAGEMLASTAAGRLARIPGSGHGSAASSRFLTV